MKAFLTSLIIFFISSYAVAYDGKILFHIMENGAPVMYGINPDGTALNKVIQNGMYPLWSPDRRMIAYLTYRDKQISDDKGFLLVISDTTGKALYTITPIYQRENGKEFYDTPWFYAWSKKGDKIAIVSMMQHKIIVRFFDTNKKQLAQVHEANFDKLSDAYLWSSVEWIDDDHLLFSNGSPGKNEDLAKILDLRTKSAENLHADAKGQNFYYSYNSGILAVVKLPASKTKFLFKVGQRSFEELFQLEGSFMPVSKPKNSKILLSGMLERHGELHSLDLKTKALTRVKTEVGYMALSPIFSPDGQKLLCILSENGTQDPKIRLREGYYIYDFVSQQMELIKPFSAELTNSFLMALYRGKMLKAHSWY